MLLFITLSASGWESVLAAALCPHAAQKSDAMPADHACCHAKLARVEQHCERASGQSEMSGMEMPDASSSKNTSVVETSALEISSPALAACEHCFSKSTPAPLNTREQNQNSRAADALFEADVRVVVAGQPFALPILKRQGAPPGTQIRSHILNSIFLI
ncbi:MAG TPA: hypothetical protein VGC91_06380 [Pyrinomonadaceae bacterium]